MKKHVKILHIIRYAIMDGNFEIAVGGPHWITEQSLNLLRGGFQDFRIVFKDIIHIKESCDSPDLH